MLFYAFGKYVSWTNWATRIEAVFVNLNRESQAKYSLLSKLIALQIGYAMFSELQRRYRVHLRGKSAKGATVESGGGVWLFRGGWRVTKCRYRLSDTEGRRGGSVNPVSVIDDANMLPNFGETGISNDSDEEDEEVVKRFTWHDIPCPLCLNPTKYPTAVKVRTLFVLGVCGGVLSTETRVPGVSHAL